MKALSGELDYRIRYDVEHDLFHAQNVFNNEYITPTFVEYVQKLEKENLKVKQACHKWFMRWREAKKDALYFDSSLQKQIEATLKLQQENAELKDYRLTTLAKQQTDMSKYALNLEHKLSWYDNKLNKAKVIINKWLRVYNTNTTKEVIKESEDFLKED